MGSPFHDQRVVTRPQVPLAGAQVTCSAFTFACPYPTMTDAQCVLRTQNVGREARPGLAFHRSPTRASWLPRYSLVNTMRWCATTNITTKEQSSSSVDWYECEHV
eukprot:scaffold26767_cov33-Tisochrysis_lutea.AAC.1